MTSIRELTSMAGIADNEAEANAIQEARNSSRMLSRALDRVANESENRKSISNRQNVNLDSAIEIFFLVTAYVYVHIPQCYLYIYFYTFIHIFRYVFISAFHAGISFLKVSC